jgi:protein ATS1
MPIFALGSNGSGQLGIGHTDDVSTPTEVVLPIPLETSTLTKVAAGGNHTLLLLDKSKLCASGKNTDYQFPTTGLNNELFGRVGGVQYPYVEAGSQIFRTAFQPPIGPLFEYKTSLCAATWEASLAYVACCTPQEGINSKPEQDIIETALLSAGSGARGELGTGVGLQKETKSVHFPNHVSTTAGAIITDLAAGMNHVVAILQDGSVWGWGAARKGQIGEPKAASIHTPRKIDGIPFKPHRVVCGKEFTYIVGDPAKGEHLILGSDKFGVISSAPKTVAGWKDIGASWGSIFVLLESGEMLSWGRDDHGQLAPKNLPNLKQIAVGSEHVVALTAYGAVIAWGWGEHGNCGLPVDEQGDVKGRWNELELPDVPGIMKVERLGAGCATTFISTVFEDIDELLQGMVPDPDEPDWAAYVNDEFLTTGP